MIIDDILIVQRARENLRVQLLHIMLLVATGVDGAHLRAYIDSLPCHGLGYAA